MENEEEKKEEKRFIDAEHTTAIISMLDKKFKGNGKDRKKNILCPWCKKKEWILADGYLVQPLSPTLSVTFSGKNIAFAVLICKNCGYNYSFCLPALMGMMEKDTKTEETKEEDSTVIEEKEEENKNIPPVFGS